MNNYLLMKSKKIPTYLKYYLSKTRLEGLVFNKTYLENLSGTSFYLDHSIEDKIKINFKASESTQNSTSGKNLLPNLIESQTIAGVQITKNADGSLTLNGTSTSGFNLNINYQSGKYVALENGQVYKMSLVNNSGLYFRLAKVSDNTIITSFDTPTTNKTFTSNYTGDTYAYFTILNNTTFNNLTIYPMLRLASITDDTYEPYTNGASPNPDYPQDIHIVKGDNEVVIENKNLLPLIEDTTIDNLGLTIEVKNGKLVINGTTTRIIYGNTSIWNSFKFSLKAGTYTFSRNNATNTMMIYDLDSNTVLISLSSQSTVNTITIDNDLDNLMFGMYIPSNTTFNNYVCEVQLEKGSTQSDWVAHKEQNYSLTLGNLEMCNINNYADEIFKNVPECEYYDNTLELGKWYKYGRIGNVVLDGSEIWKYTNGVFYINGFLRFVKGQPVLSNYFKYGGSATNTITAYQNGNNTISFNVDDGSSIYIRNDSITNINDFNDWLSAHNTEVYYVLATPTKTLLSNTLQEELDNIYNNAHTYNQITNINQVNEDRTFILDISYYRKVK